jgi:hypothetical protein
MDAPAHGNRGWDARAEQTVHSWIKLAEMYAATNQLASLWHSRANGIAQIFVAVLTVLVGSKGLSTLIAGNGTALDTVVGVCELLLGVAATLISTLELKTKATLFAKRSVGYSKLASSMRVQVVLQPPERELKADLLRSIPERVAALEETAEPLPLRYRMQAASLQAVLFPDVWRRGGSAATIVPDDAAGASTFTYDAAAEHEGNAASLLQIIMQQQL